MTTSTPKTTLRFAKFSELYTCAQVIAASFYDDELFGDYLHPYRDRYPDDMALFFYRDFLSEWFDHSMVFLVSTELHKDGKEVITGLAVWHRFGVNKRELGWGLRKWDVRNLLLPLMKHYTTLTSQLNPNRALDTTKQSIFHDSESYTNTFWQPYPDRWQLHFLAVLPSHWGKGIGRRLAAWGIERARKEGVGAGVVIAWDKDRFYQRCGFTTFLGWTGDGEGNPMGAVRGGNAWWVGAEELRGRDADWKGDVVDVVVGFGGKREVVGVTKTTANAAATAAAAAAAAATATGVDGGSPGEVERVRVRMKKDGVRDGDGTVHVSTVEVL